MAKFIMTDCENGLNTNYIKRVYVDSVQWKVMAEMNDNEIYCLHDSGYNSIAIHVHKNLIANNMEMPSEKRLNELEAKVEQECSNLILPLLKENPDGLTMNEIHSQLKYYLNIEVLDSLLETLGDSQKVSVLEGTEPEIPKGESFSEDLWRKTAKYVVGKKS